MAERFENEHLSGNLHGNYRRDMGWELCVDDITQVARNQLVAEGSSPIEWLLGKLPPNRTTSPNTSKMRGFSL